MVELARIRRERAAALEEELGGAEVAPPVKARVVAERRGARELGAIERRPDVP